MSSRARLVHLAGEVRPQPGRGYSLEAVHERGDSNFRRVEDEQVHVVVVAVELPQLGAEVGADLVHHLIAGPEHVVGERAWAVLGHEDQMEVERGNNVPATAVVTGVVIGQK